MTAATCCDARELVWKSAKVGSRWSDMQLCSACGHITRMESWLVPVQRPTEHSCINCGGTCRERKQLSITALPPGQKPRPTGPACDTCGFTPLEDRVHHEKLAELHPDRNLVKAAQAADAAGRFILSLKLATAELRWGEATDLATILRLQALFEMGLYDEAVEEAWEWAKHPDCETSVWPLIAAIEAERGDLKSSLAALKRGLEEDEEDLALWLDYAELLAHTDNRPNAANAAARALVEPELQPRALGVLADVARRYFDEQLTVDAIRICNLAGPMQSEYTPISWLRAQLAAEQNLHRSAMEWLHTTIRIDPEHPGAKQTLAEMRRPAKKTGWFGFRKS